MSLEDLEIKNELGDLYTLYKDRQKKLEYAQKDYDAVSVLLKAHPDYSRVATDPEKTNVTDYDVRVRRFDP